ncbi:uncharacterized protein N7515_010386 [Penicillium bovifimosum]|uniref:Uncharacterized protein n=1 Tax=Penicillium bovifimosum TaxID=126998 RepID=A0A9W9GEY4_9EURO|nr:uncharacterized protein N7515_010386 [Penicillium bovifimosum]KAJ5118163.1 hypothetical protein N7515_010386 [Penicillium bovifimosum]
MKHTQCETPVSTSDGSNSPSSSNFVTYFSGDPPSPKRRTYSRRNPPPNTVSTQEEGVGDRERLNEVVRWHYLRYFTAYEDTDKLIRTISPNLDSNTYEYNQLYKDVGNWTRGWKSTTMKRFKAYIEDVVTEDIVLKNMTDPGALHSYFRHNFNPRDFADVFYWIQRLLDWDKTSPLGKNFIKDIWSNLAVQLRLHWDICQTGNYRLARGDWVGILEFWDEMAHDAHYDVVKPGLETFAKKFASTAIRRAKAKVERPKGPKRKLFHPFRPLILFGKPEEQEDEGSEVKRGGDGKYLEGAMDSEWD